MSGALGSGRAMLEALIAGEQDPAVLAKRQLRTMTSELTEALIGRFSDQHAFLARTYLDLIDQHAAAIEDITERIEVVIVPFVPIRELLMSIPGVATTEADVIIAETGADMTQFPTAGHLASWAVVCPGSNESAGRVKSTKTRPGTRTSKAPWAPPPCPRRAATTPTCRPNTGASHPAADR